MSPTAYGTFVKRGKYVFRKSTFIQWGDSEKSIGACLLHNPGSAKLEKGLTDLINRKYSARGKLTIDPTMRQLIGIVERIYGNDRLISGRFHIYNLFNLQHPEAKNAVAVLEELVESGWYTISESIAPTEELQSHPWILLGWGVSHSGILLQRIKEEWLRVIEEAGIPVLGKKHEKKNDYYHPFPRGNQKWMADELVAMYREKFGKPES